MVTNSCGISYESITKAKNDYNDSASPLEKSLVYIDKTYSQEKLSKPINRVDIAYYSTTREVIKNYGADFNEVVRICEKFDKEED